MWIYILVGLLLLILVVLKSRTPHLIRDVKWLVKLSSAMRLVAKHADQKLTVADLFEKRADALTDKEALVFVPSSGDPKTYSWQQLEEHCNRVANWAYKRGLREGDNVALIMFNSPEFIFSWIGLSKIGVTTAFVNNSLKGRALEHCLNQAQPKAVFVAQSLASVVDEVRHSIPTEFFVWGGKTDGWKDMESELDGVPSTRPSRGYRKNCTSDSVMSYIYTSGTTGLPKAALIKHVRLFVAAFGFGESIDATAQDRLYVSLPLYHASAALIGCGMWLTRIPTLVLREKFSASNFFKDVTHHNCTVMLYIGEICRYLLHTPESTYDRAHNLRVALGNGLRPEVWRHFKTRFAIPRINEFYSSTEGNIAIILLEEREGAIGLIPNLVKNSYPVQLIKYDVEKDEVVRGPDGLCIRCGYNEVGQLVGVIRNTHNNQFVGYKDKQATEKKIIRDVFKKGDAYFTSGDLAKMDNDGYVFFVDRIGDTFRWKGENVSTMEVQQILSTYCNVKEVVVYGAHVPGTEGKAGMAAFIPTVSLSTFDFRDFYNHMERELTKVAMPLFLRIVKQLQTTATHKYQKFQLANEAFNPNNVQDPLYFRDDQQKTFIPLTPELYDRIVACRLPL